MQSLIHCNGCHGHINTLRKCSQERAELAGTPSMGRDVPAIQHVIGMPCDRHITKGHHAGLVVRDCACASPGWCLGFQVFQSGLQPSGTTVEKGPSPGHLGQGICELSGVILWLAESRCKHFSQRGRAVRMGGTFPVMRKGNQGGKEENFHYQGRIIRVGRMQDILRPCAKPQPTTQAHSS